MQYAQHTIYMKVHIRCDFPGSLSAYLS